jgi:hypothetical protein
MGHSAARPGGLLVRSRPAPSTVPMGGVVFEEENFAIATGEEGAASPLHAPPL